MDFCFRFLRLIGQLILLDDALNKEESCSDLRISLLSVVIARMTRVFFIFILYVTQVIFSCLRLLLFIASLITTSTPKFRRASASLLVAACLLRYPNLIHLFHFNRHHWPLMTHPVLNRQFSTVSSATLAINPSQFMIVRKYL